jgi:hypothetical protein
MSEHCQESCNHMPLRQPKAGHITQCHQQCKITVTLKVNVQYVPSKRSRRVVLPQAHGDPHDSCQIMSGGGRAPPHRASRKDRR